MNFLDWTSVSYTLFSFRSSCLLDTLFSRGRCIGHSSRINQFRYGLIEMHGKLTHILVTSGNRTLPYDQQATLGYSLVSIELRNFGPCFLFVSKTIDMEICFEIHENVYKVRCLIFEPPLMFRIPRSPSLPEFPIGLDLFCRSVWLAILMATMWESANLFFDVFIGKVFNIRDIF